MPPIDESSPLHGATPETLARDEVERSVPPPRAHLADAGVPLPALTRYRSQQNGPLEGQASRTLSSTPRDLAECSSTRQEMTTDAGDE